MKHPRCSFVRPSCLHRFGRLALAAALSFVGLCSARAQIYSDVFFAEAFRTPATLSARWSGATIATEADGIDYALKLTGTGGSTLLNATLPVDAIKGRNVVLKARVKGGTTAKTLSTDGIKVVLTYVAGGVPYANEIPLDTTIANWTETCIPVVVPANATSATLSLGMVGVAGTVYFDDVSVEGDPAVLTENFDDSAIGTRWTGTGYTTESHAGSGNALTITRPTIGTTMIWRAIPAAAVSGRRVVITGQVKATDVSTKPAAHNGIKVMLVYQTADGAYTYPQVSLETGTFGWNNFHRVILLPADVVNVRLHLGLESVSGTVSFDNIRIDANPVLHGDDFNDSATLVGRWTSGTKSVVAHGTGHALEITNTDPNVNNMTRTTLAPEVLRGKRVVLRAQINTTGISAKPASYNGIKVMLAYRRADNSYSYPQITLGTGPYNWADTSRIIDLPADVNGVWLDIGLEKVTGTVQFDNISITLMDTHSPYWENPTPYFKGHTESALRGVMVPTGLKATDVPVLASWGVNLVRWQLGGASSANSLARSDYDTVLETQLGLLDALLPTFAAADIKVVVDLHSLSTGQFVNAAAQTKLVQTWKLIANRYLGNTTIWGYDIANEPVEAGENWFPTLLNWNELADRVCQEIRNIDPTRTLIVEPARMGSVLGFPALRPVRTHNVVYSFHFYTPMAFTHQGAVTEYPDTTTYPSGIWNSTWLAAQMNPAFAFQDRYKVHLYVGEFSAVRWAVGAYDWLADVTDIFEANGWDWSYHAFREFHGWSVEVGEDKNITTPAPTPTARQLLLVSLFAEND